MCGGVFSALSVEMFASTSTADRFKSSLRDKRRSGDFHFNCDLIGGSCFV